MIPLQMLLAALVAWLDREQRDVIASAERETTRQAVQNLIDKTIIPPGDSLLQVVGNLEGILAAASGKTTERLPVMLVAGARNRRYLQIAFASMRPDTTAA